MTTVSAPLAKLAEVSSPATPQAEVDDLDLALLRALATELGSTQIGPLMAELRKLTNAPVFYIINTHVHPDHVGGNEAFAKSGAGGDVSSNGRVEGDQPLRIITHENVLNRLVAPGAPQSRVGDAASINDTYFRSPKDFLFNGEAVMVYHMPAAHTDGDSIVLFRRSDVISSGDLFTPDRYPSQSQMLVRPCVERDCGSSVAKQQAARRSLSCKCSSQIANSAPQDKSVLAHPSLAMNSSSRTAGTTDSFSSTMPTG